MCKELHLNQKWMDEVPRAFAISDIQSSPFGMKGQVYASCVRSNMTYGSETRPLLVDVGLKFERAEMQMIRWMCGISLKHRRTNEELRRLVGVESITTVVVVRLPRPMEGNGVTPIFRSLQNCQFHHRRLESLEHFNVLNIYISF